ncbi:hypothetical protein CBL_10581 [Carabus blaptoides fortunei]
MVDFSRRRHKRTTTPIPMRDADGGCNRSPYIHTSLGAHNSTLGCGWKYRKQRNGHPGARRRVKWRVSGRQRPCLPPIQIYACKTEEVTKPTWKLIRIDSSVGDSHAHDIKRGLVR